MRRVRAELTAHVGGNPTPPQRMLIDRAVMLSLRLAQLDAQIIDGATFTTHDHNYYLGWSNTLARTLARLGVQPAATTANPVRTLADLRAEARRPTGAAA